MSIKESKKQSESIERKNEMGLGAQGLGKENNPETSLETNYMSGICKTLEHENCSSLFHVSHYFLVCFDLKEHLCSVFLFLVVLIIVRLSLFSCKQMPYSQRERERERERVVR
jgi:hypothetical protein